MAALAHPVPVDEPRTFHSPEEALCAMFDIFEDALEKMPADQRKAWVERFIDSEGKTETQL